MKPLILISNDDGIQAKGLNELVRMLRSVADIIVVAPDGGRSGAASAITSAVPVTLELIHQEVGLCTYACTGTPVDCIKLALEKVPGCKPDLILSGINHGDNASVNVHYSGTMGVVLEGCMKQIPSIGFSLCSFDKEADFTFLEDAILHIVSYVLENGLPEWVCLNVNFPVVSRLQGVRVCRMTHALWHSEWVSASNPKGKQSYWLTGHFQNLEPDASDTDHWALAHGYGSVVPIQIDMTAYGCMEQMKKMEVF